MNATIAMNNGVAARATALPSMAEQARRLELFEISLLQEKVEKLEQLLAGSDRDIVELGKRCRAQAAQVAELQRAGCQLTEENANLHTQLERLTAQADARERVLKAALDKQQALDAEIKRLNALEPERTKKRADRLRKEKEELQASVAELRTANKALTTKNRELDAALDKAIRSINEGNAVDPILSVELPRVGRWNIYPCEINGHYNVLDVPNDVSQTVKVVDGQVVLPKLRPVPKALHQTILETHQVFHGGVA